METNPQKRQEIHEKSQVSQDIDMDDMCSSMR